MCKFNAPTQFDASKRLHGEYHHGAWDESRAFKAGLKKASCELRIASCELRVAGDFRRCG